MRRITKDACNAFFAGETFIRDNTRVMMFDGGERRLYLHENLIAVSNKNGVFISHCGWNSLTTRERLNGFLTFVGTGLDRVFQSKGVLYIRTQGEVFEFDEMTNDQGFVKVA